MAEGSLADKGSPAAWADLWAWADLDAGTELTVEAPTGETTDDGSDTDG